MLEKQVMSCVICGENTYSYHHIKPRSDGGSDDEWNKAPLCKKCHDIVEEIYDETRRELSLNMIHEIRNDLITLRDPIKLVKKPKIPKVIKEKLKRERECKICGSKFIFGHRMYCSDKCHKKAVRRRYAVALKKRRARTVEEIIRESKARANIRNQEKVQMALCLSCMQNAIWVESSEEEILQQETLSPE